MPTAIRCCCFLPLPAVEMIELTTENICPDELRRELFDPAAGAYCGFEGWFPHLHARCVHRTGMLDIGDCAVWVGVSSPHRDEAFRACRYIIDQIKVRLPIWKKEYYEDGHSGWVNCERCARAV